MKLLIIILTVVIIAFYVYRERIKYIVLKKIHLENIIKISRLNKKIKELGR